MSLFKTVKQLGYVDTWVKATQRRRYNTLPFHEDIEKDALTVAERIHVPVHFTNALINGADHVLGAFHWEYNRLIVVKQHLKPSYRTFVLLHELGHALRPSPYDWDEDRFGPHAQVLIEEMVVEGAAAVICDELYQASTSRAMKASAIYVASHYSHYKALFNVRTTYLDDGYKDDVYSLVEKFVSLKEGSCSTS